MGNRYKQQRQGQNRQQKTGPSHQELTNLYGSIVFDPLEQLIRELKTKGITLESGDFGHIKEVAGDEFTGRVQNLRAVIEKEVLQEHRGAFDGWFKVVVNDSFGEDESDNAFYIALPGQARKHQFIKEIAEFISTQTGRQIKVVGETKTLVKGLLDEAMNLIQKLETESGAAAGPEPKREEHPEMGFTEFLIKVKNPWRERVSGARESLGEVKGMISWLRNWVEGKTRPGKTGADAAPKPKSPIEAKKAEIARLESELGEATARRNQGVASDNDAMIASAIETRTRLTKELAVVKDQLAELEQAEIIRARVEAAAQVVANAPEAATGTFPVGTLEAAVEVKTALAAQPAGPSLTDQVAKLEADVASQLKAAEVHKAEVLLLRGTVAEVASKDATAAIKILQSVKTEEEAVATARDLAVKWTVELMELRAKAEAEKPKAEPVVTLAPTVAPASTDTTYTTDDPVAFLEGVLEDVEDDELTKVTAGLLDAVKMAMVAGKGAKRISRAVARFATKEIDVEAVVADTEAILAIAK